MPVKEPERKVRALCEHAYMLFVCLFLLWDIPYMTEAQWTFEVRGWFPPLWYGLAAAALVMSRVRLGAVWLPAGLLAWMTAMSAYRGVLEVQSGALAHGVLAFLVVLPAAKAVNRERLLRYLRGLLALWTAFLTLQAALGLWASLTGHAVFSLKGTWYIGVNLGDHRLYLNAYVTTGAVKMGLSVLLALFGAAMARKRASRVLYGLCASVQLICLSLTDCRTAFLAVGASLGVMGMVILLYRGRLRRWLRVLCAVLAVPVLASGAYLTLSGVLNGLAPHVPQELDNITMLEVPAHLLPEAEAEETTVQHRELEADNLFNDRQIIWCAAVRLLRSNPRYLLTGTTTALAPMLTNMHIAPNAFNGRPFAHVHDIYLQTLVSWGVPGFLLLAAFLVIFLLAACRLFFRHELPLWQRFVPVPVLYVMLCETVDCFTRLSENSPLLLFGCLFAGWTLALDAQARYAAYAREPAETAVDVIIPVYNAEAYVTRAVESALACPQARVILVDDGSTDGSGAVCDALAQHHARVAVLHQENRGAAAARNAGLAAAQAEYVAFLDADDVLVPGALAALTRGIGDADAIQGRIVRKLSETIPGGRVRSLPAGEALETALRDPTRHLLCHGWLFRRAALTERFDERLTMGEDGEWLLRTLRRMQRVALCGVPVYCYTVRADSALHGGTQDVNEAYLQTLRAADETLAALNAPEAAAMYRLTHLLLMLTHGDVEVAPALREAAPFAEDFRIVRLHGLSPRVLTLRLLKGRFYGLTRAAVRLRRASNRCAIEREVPSRDIPHQPEA